MARAAEQGEPGDISVRFYNVPLDALVGLLARVTGKPVVLPVPAWGTVDLDLVRSTRSDAIGKIVAVLEAQKWCVTELTNSHLKLYRDAPPDGVAETKHLNVWIVGDRIMVGLKLVELNELKEAFKCLVTPETEVWIHDLNDNSSRHATTDLDWRMILPELNRAKVRQVYLVFKPPAETKK
jgi:hypothetical protein